MPGQHPAPQEGWAAGRGITALSRVWAWCPGQAQNLLFQLGQASLFISYPCT